MSNPFYTIVLEIKEKMEKLQQSLDKTKFPQRNVWNKYSGDAICRIFMYYILKSLPKHLKILGPNVFIDRIPIEYDLLIVNQSYSPADLTRNYPASEVKAVIESKFHGIYGKRDLIPQTLAKIKTSFKTAQSFNPQIKCIYLTFQETMSTKSTEAINYWEKTKEELSEYPTFCLMNSRTEELQPNQWQAFILTIGQLF